MICYFYEDLLAVPVVRVDHVNLELQGLALQEVPE